MAGRRSNKKRVRDLDYEEQRPSKSSRTRKGTSSRTLPRKGIIDPCSPPTMASFSKVKDYNPRPLPTWDPLDNRPDPTWDPLDNEDNRPDPTWDPLDNEDNRLDPTLDPLDNQDNRLDPTLDPLDNQDNRHPTLDPLDNQDNRHPTLDPLVHQDNRRPTLDPLVHQDNRRPTLDPLVHQDNRHPTLDPLDHQDNRHPTLDPLDNQDNRPDPTLDPLDNVDNRPDPTFSSVYENKEFEPTRPINLNRTLTRSMNRTGLSNAPVTQTPTHAWLPPPRPTKASNGSVLGRLKLKGASGGMYNCTALGIGGNVDSLIADISSDATFILFVEKDLVEVPFYDQYPCIIVTTKGSPDEATRLFLMKISLKLNLPVVVLLDCTPHCFKILRDLVHLDFPRLIWLGITPSYVAKNPQHSSLMKSRDISKCKDLLDQCYFPEKYPIGFADELRVMVNVKRTLTLKALSYEYVTNDYLPTKLLHYLLLDHTTYSNIKKSQVR